MALIIVRFYFQPFAQWVITTGTPAHVGFALTSMALALVGIIGMIITKTSGKMKALYLLCMLLAVATIGFSHMSAPESMMHAIANIGMLVFPILTALTAALSKPSDSA